MTAPTALAGPAPAATARPAGRPRLARWLLRLHRPALYVWAAAVVLVGAELLWLGGPLTDAAAQGWQEYDACGMSPRCSYDQDAILRYKDLYNYLTLAVTALPFAVGAWSGAALFGRELETGTARLAWAQGVTPARWLATRLAVPAALVTVGTGLLVLLHHLAWSAGRGKLDSAKPWHDDLTLHTNGPTTVAVALAGLAVGALAGLLWRRTLPALVSALVATAVVRLLASWALPHLWPAATHVTSLRQGPAGEGIQIADGVVTATGAHVPYPDCGLWELPGCAPAYARLHATGYYAQTHPYSHYWPLQITTSLLVLAVAAVCVMAAFRLVGRATGLPLRGRWAEGSAT